MTQPIPLSILIPTVVGREEQLDNLCKKLHKYGRQYGFMNKGNLDGEMVVTYDTYEIRTLKDDKQITIGEKREILYKQAKGLFSIMVDDDDELAPNAIELILEAIKSNPDVDVISFEEYCNMDGIEYKSNHSGAYSGWEGDGNSIFPDGFNFHRTPFFKSVIRTELAKIVPIPHIRFGEDNAFADSLLPLIETEIHISEPLYRYIHISTPHMERYGFDRD